MTSIRSGTPDDEGLATLGATVRGTFERPFDPALADRHLHAMLAAQRGEGEALKPISSKPFIGQWRPRQRAALVAAAVLSSLLLTTGLSYAGVITLPGPARAVFGALGLDLPDGRDGTPEDPVPTSTPSTQPTATPTGRPTETPSSTPAPTTRPTDLPDDADDRADDGGDNANPRADDGADNADDPGSQADDGADNADDRADGGGDNASENQGDTAPR